MVFMIRNYAKHQLFFLFLLCCSTASAHHYITEKPHKYVFVFRNNDTIALSNPSDSLLDAYNNYIIQNKKNLRQAILTFDGGETLTFICHKNKWKSIKVSDGTHEVAIPDSVVQKIDDIHFSTAVLVWSGSERRPFGTGYFYIRFDTGTEKVFNKYPWLNLIIANYKYLKTLIWKQTSDYTKASENF